MSVFFDVESQIIPEIFYDDKSLFFKATLKYSNFLSQLFNSCFELYLKDGMLNTKIKLKEKHFVVTDIQFTPRERIVLIELHTNVSKKIDTHGLKYFLIPYFQYYDRIKILDLYGFEVSPKSNNEGVVLKFNNGSPYELFAYIKGNYHDAIGAMHKIIFEKYNQTKNRAD